MLKLKPENIPKSSSEKFKISYNHYEVIRNYTKTCDNTRRNVHDPSQSQENINNKNEVVDKASGRKE